MAQDLKAAVRNAFDAPLEHEFLAGVVQDSADSAVAGNLGQLHVEVLIDNVAVDQRIVRHDRLARGFHTLLQRRDAIRRDAPDRLVDTVRLQRAAQTKEFLDLLRSHFAHSITTVGEPGDVAFLGQPRQRLADRRLADFEPQHQFLMRQSLTRHDFMLENRLFDLLVSDLGKTQIFHAEFPLGS